MINKIIRKKIIEILIVTLIVIISIPTWNYFNKTIDMNLQKTLASLNNLELKLNNIDGYDNVIVNNSSMTNKKYQLSLITEKNCDNIKITINEQTKLLKDYPHKKESNTYVYTITEGTIKGSQQGYKITFNLNRNMIHYYYELKDLTYF